MQLWENKAWKKTLFEALFFLIIASIGVGGSILNYLALACQYA